MNPPSTPQIKEPPRVGVAADLPENRRGAAGFIAEDCGGESLFFCDGTAVDYPYDPIGNRISATQGSTLYDYDANSLNQYVDINGDVPEYDADGNLTRTTRRSLGGGGQTSGDDPVSLTYNAENRLVAVDDGTTRTEFVYDYMGRRVQKDVFVGGSLESTTAFVYDGWNMVEEIGDADSEYFVWGLDLSQSLQGAGGVGGLIARVDGELNAYYFQFDGNGNVGQLVDGIDGSIAARYEYDAFGQTIVADGAEAADNPYRFSTKCTDESGLVYYGYRYYLPEVGRWLNRDPIEEKGGYNLFAFVMNDPIGLWDLLGTQDSELITDPQSPEDVRKLENELPLMDPWNEYGMPYHTSAEDTWALLTLKHSRIAAAAMGFWLTVRFLNHYLYGAQSHLITYELSEMETNLIRKSRSFINKMKRLLSEIGESSKSSKIRKTVELVHSWVPGTGVQDEEHLYSAFHTIQGDLLFDGNICRNSLGTHMRGKVNIDLWDVFSFIPSNSKIYPSQTWHRAPFSKYEWLPDSIQYMPESRFMSLEKKDKVNPFLITGTIRGVYTFHYKRGEPYSGDLRRYGR